LNYRAYFIRNIKFIQIFRTRNLFDTANKYQNPKPVYSAGNFESSTNFVFLKIFHYFLYFTKKNKAYILLIIKQLRFILIFKNTLSVPFLEHLFMLLIIHFNYLLRKHLCFSFEHASNRYGNMPT